MDFIGRDDKGELGFEMTKEGVTDRYPTDEEAELLRKREGLLKESKADIIKQTAEAWKDDLSKDELDWLWGNMEASLKKSFSKSGSRNGKIDYPQNGKAASDERGRAVFGLYIAMNGRDGYTGAAKVWSPGDLDLEHIKAISMGGKDEPENWTLLRTGLNLQKGNTKLDAWVENLDKTLAKRDKAPTKAKLDKAKKDLLTQMGKMRTVTPEQFESMTVDEQKYTIRGLGYSYFNILNSGSGGGEPVSPVLGRKLALEDLRTKSAENKLLWDEMRSWHKQFAKTDSTMTQKQMLNGISRTLAKTSWPDELKNETFAYFDKTAQDVLRKQGRAE